MDLQVKGEEILEKFNLPQGLSNIGEPHLVGNLAFKTTVKPDIDIQIYAEPSLYEYNEKKIIEYHVNLGLKKYVSRKLKESNKYLTTINYLYKNTEWNIDITQTIPSDDYLQDAYRFYLKYIDLFTPQKIKIICNIKTYFFNKNMLHHSMSYYIYIAVLDENVRNVNEFTRYLKKNSINLGRFKR